MGTVGEPSPELNVGRLGAFVLLEVKVPLPGEERLHCFLHHLSPADARVLADLLRREADLLGGGK